MPPISNRCLTAIAVAAASALVCAGCGSADDSDEDAVSTASAAAASDVSEPVASIHRNRVPRKLAADITWQWQLQGDVNTNYDVDLYDVDLFDTPDEVFASLRADDRIIICYFSAGSYEVWRDDADGFAEADLGEPLDGWDDERWVDHRSPTVRAMMQQRLDLAVDRGCDGVEPDNVTAYRNDSGFALTPDDQLDFNRFLADEARARQLLVGLKNDLEQIPELVDQFDFAVNEQCHEFDECSEYRPFVEQGKPVLNAEYLERSVDAPGALCASAADLGLRTLILPLELDDSFRISCD